MYSSKGFSREYDGIDGWGADFTQDIRARLLDLMDKRSGSKTAEIAVMDQNRQKGVVKTLKQLTPSTSSKTQSSVQTSTTQQISTNSSLYQPSISLHTPAILLHPNKEQAKDLQDINEIKDATGLNVSDAADLYMTSNGDAVVALTTYKKEQDKTAQTNQPANNSKSGSSFPEEELAIFKSMWDSVSSDLPDQALPDPQTMTAEDWNKAQRAKSGLALERVLSAGRTLRDNVSQFTDNLIEVPADAIKESLKLGRGVSRVVKQSKTALANDLRRLGWDISEGAEDVVDFLADVPMEATVKSTEYLMESMGFVDFN